MYNFNPLVFEAPVTTLLNPFVIIREIRPMNHFRPSELVLSSSRTVGCIQNLTKHSQTSPLLQELTSESNKIPEICKPSDDKSKAFHNIPSGHIAHMFHLGALASVNVASKVAKHAPGSLICSQDNSSIKNGADNRASDASQLSDRLQELDSILSM
jgi:hypothetical protein